MNIKEISQYSDWDASWSGNWAILDVSYWELSYLNKPYTKDIPSFVDIVIIIWENGKSTCYLRQAEKAEFAAAIIKNIKRDEGYVDEVCKNLKVAADKFLKFAEEKINGKISFEDYQKYQNLILAYYPFHTQVKYLLDYAPKEMLEKYLPKFEAARVYAEPVFTKSVEFSNAFAQQHAEKIGISAELIQSMTKNELTAYFEKEMLPQRKDLEMRNRGSAYLFFSDKIKIYTGNNFEEVKKIIIGDTQVNELKGTSAYPGKVQGAVRIVMDPSEAKDFREGNILVTGMTRPEFLMLMEKSAAVVTDAGGVLSHAAITARELKKPCVIGTKNATKVLKDGDKVEVDAEKGIVKKL